MTVETINLSDKFFNQPILVDFNFAQKLHGGYPAPIEAATSEEAYSYGGSPTAEKPYPVINGVAVITIMGTLVHRLGYSGRYYTGYDSVTAQVNAAEADPDVKGIAFWIDSHGGLVSGCFECSDRIHSIQKPTIAMVDSNAHSAAYALASASTLR